MSVEFKRERTTRTYRDANGEWQEERKPLGNTARDLLAEQMARGHYGHLDHVPPGTWAEAGRVLRYLKAAGFSVTRTTKGG